jgi:Glycosyl transferase family 2
MIITIRDARNLLRRNVLYHRHLGVERFFIYTDQTTDGSHETVAEIPGVSIHPSSQEPGSQVPERQERNAADAVERATAEGYRWLIHLDADELICLHGSQCRPGMLQGFLARLPRQIEAVRFLPYESLLTSPEPEHPFTTPWFASPNLRLKREFQDPFRNRKFTVRGLLGHTAGKTAVRLSVGPRPFYVHDFHGPDGRDLTEIVRPYLCHYYNPGYADFGAKWTNFAERPDHYACGREVRFQKRLWRDLFNSADFSEDEKQRYYEENLILDAEYLGRLHRSLGRPVMRIESVARVFQLLKETANI